MTELTNCKIYKLSAISPDGNELIYVGSTRQRICQRLAEHRYNNKKKRTNTTANLVISCKNWKLEILESYLNVSKRDLLTQEKYYIKLFKCVNKIMPITEKLLPSPAKLL